MSKVGRQLELDLGLAIEAASAVPEEAKVLALWYQFERVMPELPWREQLRLGGEVLVQLSGICEAKAEVFWEDWQDAHNADGPVLDGDWLRGLTRQSQEIDFSELVQRSGHVRKDQQEEIADKDSVVAEVDKDAVLALVDELEAEVAKAQALSVSHAENISAWLSALSAHTTHSPQRLVDLSQAVELSLIEIWMAALLGSFSLEQRGGFYDTEQVWLERGVSL